MEFSAAQSIDNFCEVSDQSIPQLISCPSRVFVNPGIGQLANLHSLIVPMLNEDAMMKKKIEPKNDSLEVQEMKLPTIKDQIGSGLDPEIKASMAHPIISDSIDFSNNDYVSIQKEEKNSKKAVKRISDQNDARSSKNQKLSHKFKIV